MTTNQNVSEMKINFPYDNVDKLIKTAINSKFKNVREDILLGEVVFKPRKIKQPDSYFTKVKGEEGNLFEENFSNNGVIIRNMLNEYRLQIMNEKKKILEKKLNLIDSKVTKINNQFREKKSNYSPKLFSSRLIVSPLNNKKLPRTMKISEDIERKQKEIDAKYFIKKLNKDKFERLTREENKRKKLENKLMEIANNAIQNQNNSPKVLRNSNEEMKTSGGQLVNIEIKGKTNNSNYNLKSNEDANKDNQKKDSQVKLPHINHNNHNNNEYSKLRHDESVRSNNFNDHSISSKSIKKSPYYFNDPKFVKLIEIKQKYNLKKNVNLPTSEVNYYSDGGSFEDYEILKNWENSQ